MVLNSQRALAFLLSVTALSNGIALVTFLGHSLSFFTNLTLILLRNECAQLNNQLIITSAITLWQIDGETMETVRDFIFLGSKITADGDCSHEIKRHLLLVNKSYDKLSILKIRDVT